MLQDVTQSPIIDPDAIPAPAFGLAEDMDRMESDWHQHQRPQLLFCVEGAMRLYTDDAVVVLPPQRAAWIPGGQRHRVVAGRPVRLRTVYFSPSLADQGALVVFAAPPLLDQMARQACAWGPDAPDRPEIAPFYEAFWHLVAGWRSSLAMASLPAARSPALALALDLLIGRLDRPVGVADAARAASLSERTLQRRCRAELGLSLQRWLVRARMLRAVELLARPELDVAEVALACGYETSSSFTRLFHAELGEPPATWRRRHSADAAPVLG